MTIEVNIEEVPAQHAVMLRFRCPYSNISEAMTEAFSGLIDHISAVGVEEGDITGPFFALYHNTENIENWDISVGFPVAKPIPEGGKVTMGALPGGKVAVSRHVGDYSGLKEQWELFMDWLKEEGIKTIDNGDNCWESYVVAPPIETEPSKFVTELYQLIRS